MSSSEVVTYASEKKAARKSNAGRKSNVERMQIRQHEELVARRIEQERAAAERRRIQEAKRANPIQVDQRATLIGWGFGVFIAFGLNAVISFNGITSVASTVGVPDWLRYFFFGATEFLYLLFLVAYLTLASRGEKTVGVQIGMWFFAGVGIFANAYHTLKFHHWDFANPDLWIGTVLSISAPVAIVSISKLASRVVFAKPEGV